MGPPFRRNGGWLFPLLAAAILLMAGQSKQELLRIEMGKLADELEQMRKNAQGKDKGRSSDESA
jgi:hypothetical protein